MDNHSQKQSAPVKLILLSALAALLLLAGTAWWVFHSHYIILQGQVYPLSVSAMDLSGSDIDSKTLAKALPRLTKLERIDLTGTACDDLSVLDKCGALRQAVISDSNFSAEQCIAFYDIHPDAELVCGVRIGDNTYSSALQELTIAEASEQELRELAALHRLTSLDMTAFTVSDEIFDYLHGRLPDCTIIRKLSFDGGEYLSNAEILKLSANPAEEDLARLPYFTELKQINATACHDNERLLALKQQYPDIRIKWNLTVLGVSTNTLAELLDLRGASYKLQNVQDGLEQNLQYFYHLKKIDMCGCGLSNKEMEQLCTAYPDIKFVWYIGFGHWRVRTDATVFSTLVAKNADKIFNQKMGADLFKYCTDLVALDVGHSVITDVSAFANLKNLRALIITDSYPTDISAFAELDKLEFLEMNNNTIDSIECFRNNTTLRFINLYPRPGTKHIVTDLSPLYQHPSLEMAIFDKSVPQEERDRFTQSNPNCLTSFQVQADGIISTTVEWRENPYRQNLKYAFSHWKSVVGYDETTGKFIIDKSTNQYSSIKR